MVFLDKKEAAEAEAAKQQGLEEVAKQQGLEEIIDNGKAKTKATRKRVSSEELKARNERKKEEERIAKEEAAKEAAKKAEEERIAKEKAEAAEKEAAEKEAAEKKNFTQQKSSDVDDTYEILKDVREKKDKYMKNLEKYREERKKIPPKGIRTEEQQKQVNELIKFREEILTPYDDIVKRLTNKIKQYKGIIEKHRAPDDYSLRDDSYEKILKILETEVNDYEEKRKLVGGGKRRKSSKTRKQKKQKKQKKNKSKRMKKSKRSK
jgi:hypothetical protein